MLQYVQSLWPLPAKDARLSCFSTQPGAEGFKAGAFQQFHCCQRKSSIKLMSVNSQSYYKTMYFATYFKGKQLVTVPR